MDVSFVNGFSNITAGKGDLVMTKENNDTARFGQLVDSLMQKEKKSTVSSSQIIEEGRLNGDVTSGYAHSYEGVDAKNAMPQGAAANQANPHIKAKKIDRTSKLYEKSLELEGYFVKQVLSSMRKTVNKGNMFGGGFAGNMYEDMLFDEYAIKMTKNAGFGLADQIYQSLV